MVGVKCFIIFFVVAFSVERASAEYSVLNRYKLLEDRYKTMNLLRPFGHDFIFDVNMYGNLEILDIVDKAKTFNEQTGTNAEKYDRAVDFVNKYIDTEYFLKVNTSAGIPLPSFWIFGVKIVPDFRASVDVGSNISINQDTDQLTAATIMKYLPEGNDALKNAVATHFDSYSGGDDLINDAVCTTAGIPLGAPCDSLKGNAFFPNDLTIPSVGAFIRADGKIGPLFNFFRRKFFGYFNLYLRYQYDFLIRKSVEAIAWNGKIWDKGDDPPQELSINSDFKIGHQFKYVSIVGMVEELKISSLNDNIEKAGELNYKNDPIYRLHVDAKYKLSALEFTPFIGIHKREGYDISEGIYYGADAGFIFWQDRLSLLFRGMFDSEHFTMSSRLKLWLMLFEYSVKLPMVTYVNDINTSTLHSLNVRIFF